MNICIFGDSITEGFYDDEKGGWVNRLKDLRKSDHIFNLSIAGDTTEDLLNRFDNDIVDKNPDMIMFAIGINDSIYLHADKINYIDFVKFNENIKSLIENARNFSKNIFCIGLTPVDEDRTKPISWRPDMYYTNVEVEKYNNTIKDICEKENLKFVDIFSELVEDNYSGLLSDGLHPNAAGHKWIAAKIIKELQPCLK